MSSTLAGAQVIEALVTMPTIGAWHADIQTDAETAPSGRVVLSVEGQAFSGFVLRAGIDGGRARVRIVGGAGGLSKQIGARYYAGTTAGKVVSDILEDAGETLASDSSSTALAFALDRWERAAGAASRTLADVAQAAGAVWRVKPDGTVWLGPETWPAATVTGELLDEDWQSGVFTIAAESPTLTPGSVYLDQQIIEVVHFVTGSAIRTEAKIQSVQGVLSHLVERLRRESRYLGVYSCRVLKQAAGVADCIPDDERLRGFGLVRVPIRVGIPGTTLTLPDGTRCLVGFEAGDPRRPYLAGFDYASAMTLVSVGSATDFVALATRTQQALDELWRFAISHVHPTGVGPSGPASPLGPPLAGSAPVVASTKFKAQ